MGVIDNLHNFNFSGKNSRDFNLAILNKTIYNAPSRVVTMQAVPGRSGDLIIDEERFGNVEISYTVSALPSKHYELKDLARMVKGWLYANSGYAKLFDSYDESYFRLAAFNNNLEIGEVLPQLGECQLIFSCKPFRYSINGQNKIESESGITLYNKECFSSLPYIKIIGSGSGSLYINNEAFNFTNIDEYIEIDSEIKNAYKGSAAQNSKMSGAEFPKLTPGENIINFSGGIEKIVIIPRWCCL